MSSQRAACIILVCAAVLCGCSSRERPRTEVMVEIDADASIRAQAARLELEVAGGASYSGLSRVLSSTLRTPIAWPVRAALVPKQGDEGRVFELRAAAYASGADAGDDAPLVVSRVRSGYVAGRTLLLKILLSAECASLWEECEAKAERCEPVAGVAGCTPLEVDPEKLASYAPGEGKRAKGTGGAAGNDSGARTSPHDSGAGADAAHPQPGMDAAARDGATEAGSEPGLDAATQAGMDAASDAGIDAARDAAPDAEADADAGDLRPGCRIDVNNDGVAEVFADGEADPNNPCRYCDLVLDPTHFTDVTCEQVTPIDPCRVQTGVCDPSTASGTCQKQNCCRFDPVWPDGSSAAQPICPFAGQDPDGNGQQGASETWTGHCDHSGRCQGCTDGAQCDDGNSCTTDSCDSGSCTHNALLGSTCTVSQSSDGQCVTRGASAVCLLDLGKPCSMATECAADRCVDHVCCASACNGACDRCDVSGQEGNCVPDHGLCSACMKCNASGACVAEGASEDLKQECPNGSCVTGNCDGQGACGVLGAGADCGTCRACDGAGSCQLNSTDHADCGACQKCVSGACQPESAAEDLKGECASGSCTTGLCDGAGACGVLGAGTDCGTCHACDSSGTCQPNSTDHADCGLCQKCVSGACQAQTSTEDLKSECPSGNCVTGNCNGSGACDVLGAGQDCGTCHSCDGAGSCQPNSTDHTDCGTCQKCVAGGCQVQSNTEDLKNECGGYSCTMLIKGWNGNVCEKYTGSSAQNGNCSGTQPACASLGFACTGAAASATCGSAGCDKACPAGASVTSYNSLGETCFSDQLQHGCPSGQGCNGSASCWPSCTKDADCAGVAGNPFCCDVATGACSTGPCFCWNDSTCG